MCKGLIGKKLGMTSIFTPEGRYVPVTVIELGPCTVTQVKTVGTDGYNAVQLGFGSKRSVRVNKPLTGHMKKAGEELFAILKEFDADEPENYELGQKITAELFSSGETVDVIGTTKGRGFAGVIKRHGFHGSRQTHGSKSHRIPGSIGCSAWPSKVIKGKRLPGHYGVERKTAKNLKVVDVRVSENLLLVMGAVPGPKSGFVTVQKPKRAKKQ